MPHLDALTLDAGPGRFVVFLPSGPVVCSTLDEALETLEVLDRVNVVWPDEDAGARS